jgi:hypothetical protein
MPGAAYDPSLPTNVTGFTSHANAFAYRIWRQLPNESTWVLVGDVTSEEPRLDMGPFPTGTKIGRFVLAGGAPSGTFATQLSFAQNGSVLQCTPQPDTGTCNSDGVGSAQGISSLQ